MPSGTGRAVVVLAALAVSTFTFVTAETLPIGLLPLIAADLDATPSAVGQLLTGYALVVVLASIPLTRVTRAVPRRALLAGLLAVFVLADAASALAPTYWLLLVARLVVALTQALFWSVVIAAGAALFAPGVRGRAVAVLYAGSALAAVIGVPVGTLLGQATSWRVAFLALGGLGLLALVVVAAVMPTTVPGSSDADRGSAPDARRFTALVVGTALFAGGTFTAFTYLTPFLTDVSGVALTATPPVLFLRGVAGVVGVVVVAAVVDRNPWLCMVVVVAVQVVGLAAQYLGGGTRAVAVVAVAVGGFTLGAFPAVLGPRILQVAPGSSDTASAAISTSFNVGISGGALFGGVLLPVTGVASTALAGAVLTAAALAVLGAEPLLASLGSAPCSTRESPTGSASWPTAHPLPEEARSRPSARPRPRRSWKWSRTTPPARSGPTARKP